MSAEGERRGGATLGWIGVLFVGLAFAAGARPLGDNSFLTHLATGRLILDTGSIPSVDPYTFTSQGDPWVVQSWLASVLYAGLEAWGGPVAIRAAMGTVTAGVMAGAWVLSRPTSNLLVRTVLCGFVLMVGAATWSERPYMVGLLCLVVFMGAAEGHVPPWVLVPVGWVWVNVHGSYPLGLVVLFVAATGSRFDKRSNAGDGRALAWGAGGVILGGVLTPIGPKILVFPLELLARSDQLRVVAEWQAPDFTDAGQRILLVELLVAVVLLVRRPSVRSALLVALAAGLALTAARNVAVASVVLVVPMAACCAGMRGIQATQRLRSPRIAGAALILAACSMGIVGLRAPDYRLTRYPVDALAFIRARGVDLGQVRMGTGDLTGNYVELLYGATAEPMVFFDDRFDMHAPDVVEDALGLWQGRPEWRSTTDRWGLDLLLYETDGPVVRLANLAGWRTLYSDESWTLVCRRGADLGGDLRVC
ncbi:MAG: hypothetical protein AB7L84_06810 [Acidimicrobiia bacterium]